MPPSAASPPPVWRVFLRRSTYALAWLRSLTPPDRHLRRQFFGLLPIVALFLPFSGERLRVSRIGRREPFPEFPYRFVFASNLSYRSSLPFFYEHIGASVLFLERKDTALF